MKKQKPLIVLKKLLRNTLNVVVFVCAGVACISGSAAKAQEFDVLQERVLRKGASAEDMRRIADCFADGRGTKRDIYRAAAWYANAADGGDRQALEKLRQWSRSRMKQKLPKPLSRKFGISEERELEETKKLVAYLLSVRERSLGQPYNRAKKKKRSALPIVSDFLKNGANPLLVVDAVEGINDEVRKSPMSVALENADFPTLRLLLANGGDLNLPYRQPLKHAIDNVNFRYEALKKAESEKASGKKGKVSHALILKRAQENFEEAISVLEFLLQHGCDPRVRDSVGMTMLSYARCSPVVSLLIKYGAEIDARNEPGDNCSGDPGWADKHRGTALFRVVLRNCPNGVAALIDAGADVNFRDGSGATPLDVAERYTQELSSSSGEQFENATKIEAILKKAGAKRGRTR
ncbi:MAG: hypothetical protein IJX22_02560 [Opitutales bacterium]|nr:hypothetical protein [Opitutales bacterium]